MCLSTLIKEASLSTANRKPLLKTITGHIEKSTNFREPGTNIHVYSTAPIYIVQQALWKRRRNSVRTRIPGTLLVNVCLSNGCKISLKKWHYE